ncbi:LysR family transcriptional regulator [Mycolicibacterium mengxianglii]|uniref:LysR family transcriptional regulator n=1 Tax=Mycolicibacterium mengxianglii TaxID=2736649 RepID=UPI0018EF326B|nr:LysR family transcriptional regulator [Mycolicibacterium mengxianglii]
MISADDLRFFLEVSRTTRLGEAARRLNVDQTTVSRRIVKLEKDLGQRLFDRTPIGWLVTEAGRRLITHAEAIEATLIVALEDADASINGQLTGSLRVLAPDGFGSFVLIPGLHKFAASHPNLSIEVATATTHDLLTGRDFDVGITLERPSPRSVLTHRLARYELRLYASRNYLSSHGVPATLDDLHQHRMIWYIDAFLDVEPLQITDTLLPGVRIGLQANNIAGHLQAAQHGLGIAPLPTFIGGSDDRLVEVLSHSFVASRQYWLVIPRDLARLARVKEFVIALREIISANHHLIELS